MRYLSLKISETSEQSWIKKFIRFFIFFGIFTIFYNTSYFFVMSSQAQETLTAIDISQLQRQAEQGDEIAQFTLGRMHEEGKGVLQNYVEAHKWFNILASVGFEGAMDARKHLEKNMTSDQIAEAQNLALKWKESQRKPISQIFNETLGITSEKQQNQKLPVFTKPLQQKPTINEMADKNSLKSFLDDELGITPPQGLTDEHPKLINHGFIIFIVLQMVFIAINWWSYNAYYMQPHYNRPKIFWNPLTRKVMLTLPWLGIVSLIGLSFLFTDHGWLYLLFAIGSWIFMGYIGYKSIKNPDTFWLKFKEAFIAIFIYGSILFIAMVFTGILNNYLSNIEAGKVGVTLTILLITSCFFSRKFNDARFIRFLKLFLSSFALYLTWNIIAEFTMWEFLKNQWNNWMILPALIISWFLKLVIWAGPYFLYRHMIKKEMKI